MIGRRCDRRAAVSALLIVSQLFVSASIAADTAPIRARDLGVVLHGVPGPLNAITDVAGVEVGHKTLISGEGPLHVGKGPVRTGVTVVLPRGRASTTPVFAGWSTLNASGEMTGTTWLEERGLLDGPIAITNTHSVGVVRDALIGWMVEAGWTPSWHAPVVAETYDGLLNDINGFHVTAAHVREALASARGGRVEEGSVGGGTGMLCHRFKGGIGTSSRHFTHDARDYTVGALVQCNYGDRPSLRMGGVPVGLALRDKYLPCRPGGANERLPACDPVAVPGSTARDGSIIVIIATDAPLLPHQLKRVSKRAALALGRMGAISEAGSGDIFLAFSTGNPDMRSTEHQMKAVQVYPNEDLSPLFAAAVDATEEAILNALVAARDMVGADGIRAFALPQAEVREILSHPAARR